MTSHAPDEMDEVLQDVRIRLWRAQPSCENLERLGASYLVRVVSSAVIDHVRQRQRRAETPLDQVADAPAVPGALQVAPQDPFEPQDMAARLEHALDALPHNRRVVVQFHLEGYERTEIATMTGWTEAKVRNLLYRGLDMLRANLRRSA